MVIVEAHGNLLQSLERESVLKRQKAEKLENLRRPCVHVDGADAFGNALQLAVGECLACILSHDAATAEKLLTITDDWRSVKRGFVPAASSIR